MSRVKWAVLARLDRFEGLKQAELADMLDLQPISLPPPRRAERQRSDRTPARSLRIAVPNDFISPRPRDRGQAAQRARRGAQRDRLRRDRSGRRSADARASQCGEGEPAPRHSAQARPTLSAMAEPALKLAPQPDTAAVREELFGGAVAAPHPHAAAACSAGHHCPARCRLDPSRRPLCRDRQRLPRGPESAHHARHFGQRCSACWCGKASMSASTTRCSEPIPIPFQLNLKQAQSKLDTAKTQFASLSEL